MLFSVHMCISWRIICSGLRPDVHTPILLGKELGHIASVPLFVTKVLFN